MVSRVLSFAFSGIEVTEVDVQVHLANGMPAFVIVGLGDKAVTESRERVRSALQAVGLSLPPQRITVNLSPADIVKEGSHYDLPIAIGLLAEMGIIPQEEITNYAVMGELSLDGRITSVTGILPAAMGASARNKGLICPAENGSEAMWAGDFDVLAAENIVSLINHFRGSKILQKPSRKLDDSPPAYADLKDIKGQFTAKRALEIAAAGGHNLLMAGPPGSGKSMLASRLPGILPPLSAQEMLEISMINSIAGLIEQGEITKRRPFRQPHHNCSMAAMVGGGTRAKPGEITLAHTGVLFLDELPEFPRQVLDALRQPLETQKVDIARVQAHITYPADFQLIAAMNPCRCGYLSDPSRCCNRAPTCSTDYLSRISGPLLDRIDIHIEVPALSLKEISSAKPEEPSEKVAERVQLSRDIQQHRYKKEQQKTNCRATAEHINESNPISEPNRKILEEGATNLGLSMRGITRILRVARTISDLAGSAEITRESLLEAFGYRPLTAKMSAQRTKLKVVIE